MHRQNIMRRRHIGKCVLPTRFVTKHASPSDAFDVHINFPVLSTFHTQGLKHSIFPNSKSTKFQPGKRGALWVPWSLDPLLNGLRARLAHIVKRPKPIYHIETRGRHLDGRILKRARMSSHGVAPKQPV